MLTQSQIQRAWWPPCNGRFANVKLHGAGRVTVRAQIVEAVDALNACLKHHDYRTRASDTGAGVCRLKVSGSGWSNHAFWTAIDINWRSNPYGSRLRTDMPAALPRDICRIRTNNGRQVWNWGGYWRGSKDAMHYEIVCTPADLATGINWATVPSRSSQPPKQSTPLPPKKPTVDPAVKAYLEDLHQKITTQESSMYLVKCEVAGHAHRGTVWSCNGIHRQAFKNPTTLINMTAIQGEGQQFPVKLVTITDHTRCRSFEQETVLLKTVEV